MSRNPSIEPVVAVGGPRARRPQATPRTAGRRGEDRVADLQTKAFGPARFSKLLNQLPLIVPTMGRLNGTAASCMLFCNNGADGRQEVCRCDDSMPDTAGNYNTMALLKLALGLHETTRNRIRGTRNTCRDPGFHVLRQGPFCGGISLK